MNYLMYVKCDNKKAFISLFKFFASVSFDIS
jgi:hypothetical protein